MPKMKTNAAAKKRFTFTGTGKIKRKHAYHSHIPVSYTHLVIKSLLEVELLIGCGGFTAYQILTNSECPFIIHALSLD